MDTKQPQGVNTAQRMRAVAGALMALGLTAGAQAGPSSMEEYDKDGYAIHSGGSVVRTDYGECVHTSAWEPDMSIPGCDGHQVAKAEPEPEPAPVTEVAAIEREPMRYTLDSEAFFDFDKSELRDEGKQELDAIAERLDRDTRVSRVEIVGHTDRIGPEEYNQKLSQERAQAVSDYLRERVSIEPDRFTVRGAGEAEPIAGCENAQNVIKCLQPNRRVDITIEAVEDISDAEPVSLR